MSDDLFPYKNARLTEEVVRREHAIFNRRRALYLSHEFLMEVLPKLIELPEGAVVHAVKDDFESQSIVLIIKHESFEHVAPGSRAPTFFAELKADKK